MSDVPPTLDLLQLGEPPGLPAMTPPKGGMHAEAAAVCLEDRQHTQGVSLCVKGMDERKYSLLWPAVTKQMRQTYNDLQDATRDGACAIAALLARELTGLTVLRQSRKGTGFDYWIGKSEEDLFQGASRLEVSGILNGDDSTIKSRVSKKKKQTERSDDTGLPAYACVVEFSRPEARFVKR